MTELLKQLQQYPKIWEKFVEWIRTNTDFELVRSDAPYFFNVKTDIKISKHELNGLLTSFCDVEGYEVFVMRSVAEPDKRIYDIFFGKEYWHQLIRNLMKEKEK